MQSFRLVHPYFGVILCTYAVMLMVDAASAQDLFRSGSTGADGAFSPTEDVVINMNTKPNGIWHYTTINIPTGVTVRFTPNAANTPVIWLASGSVTIAGIINLDGADGTGNTEPGNEALGGPGGFRGGRAGKSIAFAPPVAATPGEGPGGGLPGPLSGGCGGGGGYATNGGGAEVGGPSLGGPAYGDILVQSLIGGSGGGGGSRLFNGGGGGGAILIASSGTIRFNSGIIRADGGSAIFSGLPTGGGGAGGSIRLVANRIGGGGTLAAGGGSGCIIPTQVGSVGRIRLESFFNTAGLSSSPAFSAGPPLSVSTATSSATIRITNVAGQTVPNPPAGTTNTPDVAFAVVVPGTITISLATTNIPTGTPLTVRIATGGQVIQVQSTPTAADGTAMATATVPEGIGTIQAFADYIPPRP